MKYLKRKQKWQSNRLLFKKRRLKRKLVYTTRLNSVFAKKLRSIKSLTNKPTTPNATRSRLVNKKNLTSKNYDRLSNSLVNKSINITGGAHYLDNYIVSNNSRNLVIHFLTKHFSINQISKFLDTSLPSDYSSATRKYALMSLSSTALSPQAAQYTYNTSTNVTKKKKEFTFSKSSLRHSLYAWSYNASKTLHGGNKSYSSFTFSDGFVPILVSGSIQIRDDLKTSRNLALTSLARTTFFSNNNNSRQLMLEPFLQKVRRLWIDKARLILSKRHSCKRSKSLRSKRRRKLSRGHALRTQGTQVNKLVTRYYSYRGKNKRSKHITARKNLVRFISLLKGTLYSTHLNTSSVRAVSTQSNIAQSSLDSNVTRVLHSHSKQCNALKTIFRLSPGIISSYNNIYPSVNPAHRTFRSFRPTLTKDLNFYPDVLPWVNDNIIRLIENSSGKRSLVQHSMHAENTVDAKSKLEYKKWITRMAYYERNLGHRFFMEEALHIIHLSFRYHDVTLFSSWLKAIITRISFWKTRSIFRFLKYVFNNYYRFIFDSLSIKGIKIRLKGKISAAGNSRKRTILFRSGKNSYSSVNIKCIHEFKTITTFTGVMGFQVWLFY